MSYGSGLLRPGLNSGRAWWMMRLITVVAKLKACVYSEDTRQSL